MFSPLIRLSAGMDCDSLNGKAKVADFWKKALHKLTDSYLELKDITEGGDSVAVYYSSIGDPRSIEVMFFDDQGSLNKVAHYNLAIS